MSNKRVIAFRRKREGKTNYHKRLELLKSKKVRLVVRKTQKYIIVQFVEYVPTGDKIIASATSKDLIKQGWNYSCKNLPSAYLIGYLIGKKAKVKEAILDLGGHVSIKQNKIYAVVKGVIDSGVKIPCNKEALPSKERIEGSHIVSYAKTLDEKTAEQKFSGYIKKKADVSKLSENFEAVKKKING